MGDLYQTSRTTGPTYRARPGLWLHRPRSTSSLASGVVAWAGGLALLVILAAGVTRLLLGWHGG